jgi:hypothetical protein
MRTTSDAWPETNLELLLREQQFMRDPGEEPAEQSVGAAVLHVGDSRTGRLLVLGDSDLLVGLTPNDNPVIQILLGSVLRWAMPEDNLAFFADAGARVSTADAKANSDQWKLLVLAGLLALGGLLSLAWKREVQGTRQASLAPLAAAGLVILVVSASGLVERPALSGADSGGSAHVVSHAPGQVRQVEIATAAGIVTLTRENTGWARQALDDQSPWTDEDSARVDLLLGVLESAPRGSEQAITSGVDMSLLGLSEPRLQLTLTDNDGEAETVAFGGYPESAPGQIMGYTQVWARRTGEDKVFTVPDGLFALAAQLAPTVDEESPEPGAEPTP